MDNLDFSGFAEQAVHFIAALSDAAADMDGRAAFLLGLVTWFLVEQAVRRLAGVLRWAILAAALTGGGVAVVSLLGVLGDGNISGAAVEMEPSAQRSQPVPVRP